MKKEKLKRIKALLLAITMCLTLSSCSSSKEQSKDKTNDKGAIVLFIEDKALIYSGDYNKSVNAEYIGIGGTMLKYSEITRFSVGTAAAEVKSLDDAVELAEAIVGEENIIYIDYKDEDMQLSYTKKK